MDFHEAVLDQLIKNHCLKSVRKFCQLYPENIQRAKNQALKYPEILLAEAIYKKLEDNEYQDSEVLNLMTRLLFTIVVIIVRKVQHHPGKYEEEIRDVLLDNRGQEEKIPILFEIGENWIDLVYDHLVNRENKPFLPQKLFDFLPPILARNLNFILNRILLDFWDPEQWMEEELEEYKVEMDTQLMNSLVDESTLIEEIKKSFKKIIYQRVII